MSGHDLRVRDRQPELMDQPGLDPQLHAQALRGLRRINRWSRSVAMLWRQLKLELLYKQQRTSNFRAELHVLDVACGGGDTVVALASRAQRSSLPICVDGCDFSATAVELAKHEADRENLDHVNFFIADALHDQLPADYDVVMCSLFLHHLDELEAVRLLQQMQVARQAVLVNDLRRTRLGFYLAYLGTRILSRSRIVHTDGPLSVRAAWAEPEVADVARQAGMVNVRFERFWPQRFLMSWRRGT